MFTAGIGGNFVIANAINDAGELSAVPLFLIGHNPRLSQNRGNSLAPEWIRVSAVVEPCPIRRSEDAVDEILLVLWLLGLVNSYSPCCTRPGEVLADRSVDPFKNKSMKFKENM